MRKNVKNVQANLNHLIWILFAIFGIESFYFAFTTLPNFDEQLYLFKGAQIVTGATYFLEPTSYWWNKMVGSFVFWGWIQRIAGNGFFAPRVVIAILNIAAAYFYQDIVKRSLPAVNRPILIGMMILSFPMISNWSVANSQVLVNFLLAAALWILSKQEWRWQELVALGIVNAMLVLTRENMVFFLPPAFIFILWRAGWKRAFLWAGVVSFIGGFWFAANYPNDIMLLTRFIPSIVLPDLELYQKFTMEQNSVEVFEFTKTLRAISYTLRMAPIYYWGALAGSLTAASTFLKRPLEKDRFFGFLAILFWFLFLPRVWVTQSLGYCVYCLATYSGFFISIGALLFLYSLNTASQHRSMSFSALTWGTFLLFTILFLVVPMIDTAKELIAGPNGWNNGPIWLANALTNKLQLSSLEFRQLWLVLVSIAAGSLVWVLLVIAVGFLKKNERWASFGLNGVLLVLFCLNAFSNLMIEGKVTRCRSDVVGWSAKTANEITRTLPADPVIYLNGEWAALPLLYLDQPFEIFKPQLNSNFSYSSTISNENIQRFGLWNASLSEKWQAKANVFFFDRPEFEKFADGIEMNEFRIYNYAYAPQGCEVQIDLYSLVRKE